MEDPVARVLITGLIIAGFLLIYPPPTFLNHLRKLISFLAGSEEAPAQKGGRSAYVRRR